MNDEAFVDAFLSHLDMLHNLARGLSDTAQDAEDLVQETCLLGLRGWRRRAPDDPRAWLATVCLNAARSRYRQRAVRPYEVRADDWLLERADSVDTADQALAAVDVARVRAALRQLPDVQREAITLMDLAGCTAATTAAIVGAPRGTVLARVHRGRKALALLLRDGQEVDGHGPRP
jgi:RNA polymerase sigma-70 factor (ECF subfamily)